MKKKRLPRQPKKYPLIHETVLSSPEWEAWEHFQDYYAHKWDVAETRECGWMSAEHWQAFIKWIIEGGKHDEGIF